MAELLDLFATGDAEDRAWAAFMLGAFPHQASVAVLGTGVRDSDPNVRGMAAQSLAQLGRGEFLPDILDLIAEDSGQDVTPVVWAAAQLARDASPTLQKRSNAELNRLSKRASPRVLNQLRVLGVSVDLVKFPGEDETGYRA